MKKQKKKNKQCKPKLFLVASSGGHLVQLYNLKPFWGKYPRVWATFKTQQSEIMLKNETVLWLRHPTNVRSIKDFKYALNSFINVVSMFFFMLRHKVTHVLSTGAAPGVSAIWSARILFLGRVKGIFIDSFTRPFSMSFSAKLNYFIADHILTQWPDMAKKYKRLKYKGKVL